MFTAAAATAGKLIGAGICLGVGFWMSKKLTGVADQYLLQFDKRELARLQKELGLEGV